MNHPEWIAILDYGSQLPNSLLVGEAQVYL